MGELLCYLYIIRLLEGTMAIDKTFSTKIVAHFLIDAYFFRIESDVQFSIITLLLKVDYIYIYF